MYSGLAIKSASLLRPFFAGPQGGGLVSGASLYFGSSLECSKLHQTNMPWTLLQPIFCIKCMPKLVSKQLHLLLTIIQFLAIRAKKMLVK